MPLVLEAARTEFRKLEKPINEADFRWLEPAGARHEHQPAYRAADFGWPAGDNAVRGRWCKQQSRPNFRTCCERKA